MIQFWAVFVKFRPFGGQQTIQNWCFQPVSGKLITKSIHKFTSNLVHTRIKFIWNYSIWGFVMLISVLRRPIVVKMIVTEYNSENYSVHFRVSIRQAIKQPTTKSWGIEAKKLSRWNLTGIWAALLPRLLSNSERSESHGEKNENCGFCSLP